MNKTDICWK